MLLDSLTAVIATLRALDDANDVTSEMEARICKSIVKQTAMSANFDEEELECEQAVAGVPVKV
jgi:hypothetical protein